MSAELKWTPEMAKNLITVLDEIIFLQNRLLSAERRLDALEGR